MPGTPGDVRSDKRRLRDEMRSRLGSTTPAQARAAGEEAAARLVGWSNWRSATAVALFATMPGEVDTAPISECARAEGKRVFFPRMIAGSTLEFAPVDRPQDLRAGRKGVSEPDTRIPGCELPTDAIVLVPGVAFDREGGRLGRGAGYYDRALEGYAAEPERPCFIGLAFAFQIVAIVPTTSLDVRMDGVVTEAGLTRRT